MPIERVTQDEDGKTWVDPEPGEVAYGYAMQNAMIASNFRKENFLRLEVYDQGDRNPKNSSAGGIFPKVRVLPSEMVVNIDGAPYKVSSVQNIDFDFEDKWDSYYYFYLYPTDGIYEVKSIWYRDYTFARLGGIHNTIKWKSGNGYEGYVLPLGGKDYTMLHQFLYVNKFGKGFICKFPERHETEIWCPHHVYNLGEVVRYKESIMVSRKDNNKSTPPQDWDFLVIDIEGTPHFQPDYYLPPIGTMISIQTIIGGTSIDKGNLYSKYMEAYRKLPKVGTWRYAGKVLGNPNIDWKEEYRKSLADWEVWDNFWEVRDQYGGYTPVLWYEQPDLGRSTSNNDIITTDPSKYGHRSGSGVGFRTVYESLNRAYTGVRTHFIFDFYRVG